MNLKKQKGLQLRQKKYFAEGNMKLAGRYWSRIFTAKISFAQRSQVMQMFINEEVYRIADWNREHYYRVIGLV